jgi:ATP-dependent DNA ligase
MLQRTLPAGFIAPCLPSKTDKLPSGGEWLHEIKHDGFRVIARKKGAQVRLYSRPGNVVPHPVAGLIVYGSTHLTASKSLTATALHKTI